MLKGKTAIITGGGRGIGKAIAMKLSALGANIVINDIPSSAAAQEAADEIKANGGNAIAVCGDVSVLSDMERVVEETVKAFGSVDIMVNNAGITRDTLLVRMTEKDFDDVISVNLKGAFNGVKAVARTMIKQKGGSIINVSSVVGLMGNIGQINYSASKAGIVGLTKSAAKELASRGIRCNAIAPGFISSDMTDKLTDEVKKSYLDAIPMKKFGTAEDVANVVAFLASDNSAYITGQVLQIDGGLLM